MIYRTSFCNKGHLIKNGRPVDHQCYILPPEAIAAERNDDFEKAVQILRAHAPLEVAGRDPQ
jgi:hypothetical protein